MQADLELHTRHAKIVAGDVVDLGRPFVDADAAREFHRRRQVGDHMQLPARLLVAAGLERDLGARGDRLLDLVLALADGVELERLAVDIEFRRTAAARVIDEARDLRADRHTQKLVVVGHVEIDRRLAGIGRRRDPEIGDNRRRRRKCRDEGAHHAIVAPAARHHDRDDQRQHRYYAQRPGIDDRENRLRRLVDQAGETLGFAAAMRLPQRDSHRIGAARGQLILYGDQRAMRHARVALEAADRNVARRPTERAQEEKAEAQEAEGQDGENAGVNPGIEASEQVEMGRRHEQHHGRHQRHQTRPQAFPGQRRARQTDLALHSEALDRPGLRRVHRVLSRS